MDGIEEVVSQDHDGSKEADGPFNGAILATLPQRLL
jgi:hypothetical protein